MSSTPQVDWQHPSYKNHLNQVTVCNDIYAGIDTAKEYLVQLRNEDNDSFADRKKLATLNNFISRICKSLSGQIMRKPLTYEDIPENIIDLTETISGQENINQFAKDLSDIAIRDGKAFVLVDAPVGGGDPYLSMIERSQVVNWKIDEDGLYTLVVIAEAYTIEDGEFGFEVKEQYRVIDAVGNVQIWRESNENKTVWTIVEEIITSYNFCPFYVLDVGEIPPLYDLALVNIKHMNIVSLIDRFVTQTLDPILFLKGTKIDSTEEDPFVLGVNNMINVDDTEADLKWIEVDGSNYEQASKLKESYEEEMSAIALKVQSDSDQVKTATQVSTDSKEGTARLNDIAMELQNVLSSSMNAFSMIKYSKELTGRIIVNTDFNSVSVDSNVLTALNTLEVSGNMTKEDLLKALNNSEYVEIEDIDATAQELREQSLLIEEDTGAE